MQQIVVNDTNIFIDLISISLIDEFFTLPIIVHTTDFVINELTEPEQRNKVLSFSNEKLFVKNHDGNEIIEIFELKNTCNNNVSFIDCSVWLYAKKNSFSLLTGDSKLRSLALKSGTDVKGILYIFDILVEHKIITPTTASIKLSLLYSINKRLPNSEVKKRLMLWDS